MVRELGNPLGNPLGLPRSQRSDVTSSEVWLNNSSVSLVVNDINVNTANIVHTVTTGYNNYEGICAFSDGIVISCEYNNALYIKWSQVDVNTGLPIKVKQTVSNSTGDADLSALYYGISKGTSTSILGALGTSDKYYWLYGGSLYYLEYNGTTVAAKKVSNFTSHSGTTTVGSLAFTTATISINNTLNLTPPVTVDSDGDLVFVFNSSIGIIVEKRSRADLSVIVASIKIQDLISSAYLSNICISKAGDYFIVSLFFCNMSTSSIQSKMYVLNANLTLLTSITFDTTTDGAINASSLVAFHCTYYDTSTQNLIFKALAKNSDFTSSLDTRYLHYRRAQINLSSLSVSGLYSNALTSLIYFVEADLYADYNNNSLPYIQYVEQPSYISNIADKSALSGRKAELLQVKTQKHSHLEVNNLYVLDINTPTTLVVPMLYFNSVGGVETGYMSAYLLGAFNNGKLVLSTSKGYYTCIKLVDSII